MTTLLTLAFDEPLTEEEIQEVSQLLRDALGEFRDARTPIQEYIARRYSYLGPESAEEKGNQVRLRTSLALKVLRARVLKALDGH